MKDIQETILLPSSFHVAFLIGDHGSNVSELKQISHCTVEFSSKNEAPFICLYGCQEEIEMGRKWIENAIRKYEETHRVIPIPELAIPLLLNNNGKEIQRIEKEWQVALQIDKSNLRMVICGPASQIDSVQKVVMTLIERIATVQIPIHFQLKGEFMGMKGSHIEKIRKQFHVTVKLITESKTDFIVIEGFDSNVKGAQSYVTSWLDDHWIETITDEKEVIGKVVIGTKGKIVSEIERRFEIGVTQKIETSSVLLCGKKTNVEDAKKWIMQQMEEYKSTHFFCKFHRDHFSFAPELSRSFFSGLRSRYKHCCIIVKAMEGIVRCEGPGPEITSIRKELLSIYHRLQGYRVFHHSIPAEHLGLVIGRDGNTISTLQKQFECRITVKHESNEIVVWIHEDKAESLFHEISSLIETKQVLTHTVSLTANQIHLLLLDRCRPLLSIEALSNASMKLPKQKQSDKILTISGNKKSVEMAETFTQSVFRGNFTYIYEYDSEAIEALFAATDFPIERIELAHHCNISHDSHGAVQIRGEYDSIHRAHQELFNELISLFPTRFAKIPIDLGVAHFLMSFGMKMDRKGSNVRIIAEPQESFIYCSGDERQLLSESDRVAKRVTELAARNVVIPVEPELLAHVVGSKGRRIKQIMESSGARVEVLPSNDQVYIHGEIDSVQRAREQIDKIVDEYHALNEVIETTAQMIDKFRENYGSLFCKWEEKYEGQIILDKEKRLVRIKGRTREGTQDLKYIIESVLESEQLEEEQNESLDVENVHNNSPNEKDYKKEIAVLLGFDSLYFCLLMEVIDQFPEPWKSPLVHCEKILNRNSVVY